MSLTEVLLIAGTHGNEINAAWLFDQFKENPAPINRRGLNVSAVIGNPSAREKCLRYIDRDLNRSFSLKLLSSVSSENEYEIKRAKELLNSYGKKSQKPASVVLDFHSTTASMGSSIVIYGRRFPDLALAGLIQKRLGWPIYLHECDNSQTGFLVEQWPCGLVIEIGPVPQGVLRKNIINQTMLAIQTCLDELEKIKCSNYTFPKEIVIHRHLKSIDFPRSLTGQITAFIDQSIEGKDWIPINQGDDIFDNFRGVKLTLDDPDLPNSVVPIFINEAAYMEKGIAFSLTTKESWKFNQCWSNSLISLISH